MGRLQRERIIVEKYTVGGSVKVVELPRPQRPQKRTEAEQQGPPGSGTTGCSRAAASGPTQSVADHDQRRRRHGNHRDERDHQPGNGERDGKYVVKKREGEEFSLISRVARRATLTAFCTGSSRAPWNTRAAAVWLRSTADAGDMET